MSFVIDNWNKEEIKANDEFNTMWNVSKREGKIEGLKTFIDGIEKLALDND